VVEFAEGSQPADLPALTTSKLFMYEKYVKDEDGNPVTKMVKNREPADARREAWEVIRKYCPTTMTLQKHPKEFTSYEP
jgi:hypothetical protein